MPRPTGEDGHRLLDLIWKHLSDFGCWPTFDEVDRRLYASGLRFEEAVQQLCPALLRGVSTHPHVMPRGADELSLTIAGAANCTDTGAAINVFLAMVRTAATIEPHYRPREPGQLPELRAVDLRSTLDAADPNLLTIEVMYGAFMLARHEPCFRGSSLGADRRDWALSFDRDIRPYGGVSRLKDYWSIREEAVGPERAEADRQPFQSGGAPVVAPVPADPQAAPAPEGEATDTLSVTCILHPLIAKAAAERFARGFYLDAVSRAFQAIEHRVQELAGSHEIGENLMGIAFGARKEAPPRLTVTRSTGGSLKSEQNGMQFLFKGATGALRNPRMHGPADDDDHDEAQEMLVFASFLMRRLDIEDERRRLTPPSAAEVAAMAAAWGAAKYGIKENPVLLAKARAEYRRQEAAAREDSGGA